MPNVLTPDQIAEALGSLPDWQEVNGELVRTAELASFPRAIAVVDRVAELAEAADHHPDIDIRWRTLTFRCSTHSAGGITEHDLGLAAAINAAIAAG